MLNKFNPILSIDPDRFTGLLHVQPGTTQPKSERREIPDGDLFKEAHAVREREELADKVAALEAEVKRLDALKGSLQKLLDNALNTIDILTEMNMVSRSKTCSRSAANCSTWSKPT